MTEKMKAQKKMIKAGVGLAVVCAALQGCKPQKSPMAENVGVTEPPTVIAPAPTLTSTLEPSDVDIGVPASNEQPPAPAIAVKPLPPPPPPPAAKPVRPLPRPAPVVAAPAAPAPAAVTYKVVKGDTFGGIAHRNGIKLAMLQKANPSITDPNKLRIGQTVNIPAPAAVPAAVPAAAPAPAAAKPAPAAAPGGEYVVKNGDALDRIARRFKTTSKAIREANGLKSDTIRVGQKLKIPGAAAAAAQPKQAKAAAKPAKAGPAAKPATAAEAKAKPADEKKPAAGEESKAAAESVEPAPADDAKAAQPEYKKYTVQEGEDLYAIAIKARVSVNKLRDLNSKLLHGDTFDAGTTILLPPEANLE